MPIDWCQPPRYSVTRGYGDILRYVSRYRRLDSFDLVLASFENSHISDPEAREGYLDRQRAKASRPSPSRPKVKTKQTGRTEAHRAGQQRRWQKHRENRKKQHPVS